MKFEFSKTHQEFSACQDVNLTRIKRDNEYVLMCKCTGRGDRAGIIRTITLPQLTSYTLEVTGWANNGITYLYVADLQGHELYDDYVFLPKARDTVILKFSPRTTQIRIGVLMGADSFAVPGYYFNVVEIQLTCTSRKDYLPGSSDLRITRVFETVSDLAREAEEPLRGQGTPMEVGEYAVLKSEDKVYDDLYILSRNGLQYVCRIGEGLPSFFGEALHSHPGKVMPVYEDRKDAEKDLRDNPEKFYEPKGLSLWSNLRGEISDDIYLYLDDKGYVRWLKRSQIL